MKYSDALTFARAMRKKQTPAEKFFWEKVRNHRFMRKKFYRQYIIQHDESQGRKQFFIADFYCHDKRLVIELDGKIHLQQQEYDAARTAILTEMGFSVIRFDNEAILKSWEKVAEELKMILA